MASSSNQVQQQPINYSADAPVAAASSIVAKPPVTIDEDLFLFLPRLGDILKSFEKNPGDVKLKLEELRKQFESCHDMISRVDGIDTTLDDQRSELSRLDLELKSKTELLKKHIHHCKFDLNMPPKPDRIISETDEDPTQQSSQTPANAMNINDDDDDDEDDNEDDDDPFQSDHHTNAHPGATNENLSSFFS